MKLNSEYATRLGLGAVILGLLPFFCTVLAAGFLLHPLMELHGLWIGPAPEDAPRLAGLSFMAGLSFAALGGVASLLAVPIFVRIGRWPRPRRIRLRLAIVLLWLSTASFILCIATLAMELRGGHGAVAFFGSD